MWGRQRDIEGFWTGGQFVGAALALLLLWILLVFGAPHFMPHKLTIVKTGDMLMLVVEKSE